MSHPRVHLSLGLALAVLGVLACRPPAVDRTDALVGRPNSGPAAQRGNLWYRIALDGERMDVAVRLFSPPPRTRFFLPGSWAGRTDFGEVIGIAGASTPAGPASVAIDRQAGQIEVETADAAWVQLEYRVEFTKRSEFHPQLDNGVLLAFGPTFLVTPAQQILERTTEIPIELSVPAEAQVLSTWPAFGSAPSRSAADRAVHQFIAADVGELRDAFVVVGDTLRRVEFGQGDELVEVGFAPAFEGDTAAFAQVVADATHQFRSWFGNAGPVHVYVRTAASRRGEIGGLGRRGGFVLDVPPDTEPAPATRLLIAHESLHIWNGHLLLPQQSVEASTRWFKEGVTHYLALKALAGLGEEFVLGELAQIAGNYARNPLSRGEAARDIDVARLPYDFGVLVALGFDAALATARTEPPQDLRCWLTTLLARQDRKYDEETLYAALRECADPAAGRQLAQLWRQWVRTRQPIDLRRLFADLGLHWLPETPQRAARLVPLDTPAPLYRTLFGLEKP